MEALHIEGTKVSPQVTLDKSSGKFSIEGISTPHDPAGFFSPVLSWLDRYADSANAETYFDFRLNYFNTATSKFFLNIMFKLEKVIEAGNEVLVRWYYDSDDDMKEAGESYMDVVQVPIELIPNEG